MAAADSRSKCPVCGALSQSRGEGRRLASQAPIYGEHPRRRAQAAKIRQQNGKGK